MKKKPTIPVKNKIMKYDSDIFDAVEFGDIESVKMYWTKDIDINFQDNNGVNLIMLASRYNHKEIVNHLLLLNPNLYLTNKEDETVFQIAERLEDQEIYTKLVEYCWKENEKMFFFEYHAEPNFESDILGAYINCWIMDEDYNRAKIRSQKLIHEENWAIKSIEKSSEMEKINYEKDKNQYYEQSIIDKEVLVFYTYDNEND